MKRKKKKQERRIILMDIPWDIYFGRQVQRGVCRYAWPARPWVLHHIWQWADTKQEMQHADTVGMISMRHPQEYADDARRYGLAAVGVGKWAPECKDLHLAYVDVDPKAIGKIAADYFINRGFRNFGMFAWNENYHSRYRGEAFVEAIRRKKLPCDVFERGKEYPPCGGPIPAVSSGSEQMRRWMAGLPKPLGIFCIDDATGLWVCELCQRIGIHVPEEVAVLSADDDDMFCSIVYPHLSSVALPAEQVGFEAAKLLDALLSGKKPPKRPILLPPAAVVSRQSTDIIAIDDYRVAEAIRFIRENAHKGIHVESMVAETSLPRRTLERRFQKVLKRSPFEEIKRVRLDRVKMLLMQTDKTLEAIAPECGFSGITRMSPAFKKATGMSPGAWRKQFRNQ